MLPLLAAALLRLNLHGARDLGRLGAGLGARLISGLLIVLVLIWHGYLPPR